MKTLDQYKYLLGHRRYRVSKKTISEVETTQQDNAKYLYGRQLKRLPFAYISESYNGLCLIGNNINIKGVTMPKAYKVTLANGSGTVLQTDIAVDQTTGAWTADVEQSISANSHNSIKAKARDVAGNESGYSGTVYYVSGSNVTPTCQLKAGSDSGGISDGITNVKKPYVTISLTLPTPTGAVSLNRSSVTEITLLIRKRGFSDIVLAPVTSFTGTGNLFQCDVQLQTTDVANGGSANGDLTDGKWDVQASWNDLGGDNSEWGTVYTIEIDSDAPDTPSISTVSGTVFIGTSVSIAGVANNSAD